MMIHRHFEEKAAEAGLKPEAVQKPAEIPEAVKVEEGADIVPEPATAEKVESTRTRRKK